MSLEHIEQLLQEHMGLHSATVGSSTVAQAVDKRMRACDIDTVTRYEQILRHSATELDALIDTVIIPETWFFRDRNPFSAFSEWVRNEWLLHTPHKPLRVLSVPCSTGEEPYTLAMCLADCGLPAVAAHIDAIDISSSNIASANKGIYGSNSFRGNDLSFRDTHFIAVDANYRISDDIRSRVNFIQANMLDQTFLAGREPYQVIFCRNLLIYFDRPTQHRAIDRLEQLLSNDGVLFLGHSETSLLLERDFTSLAYNRCFGFRKGRPKRAEPRQAKIARRQRNATSSTPRPRAQKPQPKPFSNNVEPSTRLPDEPPPAQQQAQLEDAFRLADQGHLDEAAQLCESLMRGQAHQADAHFLLGLIREAAGNSEAAQQMFRKAVYLDPDHHQALAHLGVIHERQGDLTNAQRYKHRAERAAARSKVEGAAE